MLSLIKIKHHDLLEYKRKCTECRASLEEQKYYAVSATGKDDSVFIKPDNEDHSLYRVAYFCFKCWSSIAGKDYSFEEDPSL